MDNFLVLQQERFGFFKVTSTLNIKDNLISIKTDKFKKNLKPFKFF